jgi:large subunit ribosomal protein L6
MSRIGKKPTIIPAKTDVTVNESSVIVKGPLGELTLSYRPEAVTIKVEDGTVTVLNNNESLESRALWGTYASEIAAMVADPNTKVSMKSS